MAETRTFKDKINDSINNTSNKVKYYNNKYRWIVFAISLVIMLATFVVASYTISDYNLTNGLSKCGFAFAIFWFALYFFVVVYVFYLAVRKEQIIYKDNKTVVILLTLFSSCCLLISFSTMRSGIVAPYALADTYIGLGFFGLFAIFGSTLPLLTLKRRD